MSGFSFKRKRPVEKADDSAKDSGIDFEELDLGAFSDDAVPSEATEAPRKTPKDTAVSAKNSQKGPKSTATPAKNHKAKPSAKPTAGPEKQRSTPPQRETADAVNRRFGKTTLDVERQDPTWDEEEQRVHDRIDNLKVANDFWLKTWRPVGRAEAKLEGAVKAFDFDFAGKTVMDIGASTGGFTELALRSGAEKVIAVEKGTNQMKEPLRSLPEVDLHEKTDIFVVRPELAEPVDVFLIDVSFISLRPVLTYVKDDLVAGKTGASKQAPPAVARMSEKRPHRAKEVNIIAMLKPQFEAQPQDLQRGVIKNEKIRRRIAKEFEEWTKRKGFITIAKHDSDLPGKSGNIERFYWLRIARRS